MLRCAKGHETRAAPKCETCGAKVLFREALPDLLALPRFDVKFEEVAVLYVGSLRPEERGSTPPRC